MWGYYGAKTLLVDCYPKPVHDKIIEPFAGSARYALKHFEKDVLLVDKYPVIVSIWNWLKVCSPEDVLRLPKTVKPGQTINDFNFDSDAERYLFGFLIGKAPEAPRNKVSDRVSIARPNYINYSLQRIAKNLYKIRHWNIIEGSYEMIPNQVCTWFIDPPYQFGGGCYPKSSRHINYSDLAGWCTVRTGQQIICENTKANWLPFVPLKSITGSNGKSTEAIYTNFNTHYNNIQQTLF
jgi:hypothetical protein